MKKLIIITICLFSLIACTSKSSVDLKKEYIMSSFKHCEKLQQVTIKDKNDILQQYLNLIDDYYLCYFNNKYNYNILNNM